ncbi:uncharacterized protein PAC_06444 [Phialocephala subalpina]|uniref:F-box domain-containing protein n=1 Tax=Phialocephala subalpina TaxID=576137 RepID=A0A1L7WUU8_9HELO|nr:uncharacterized protein PAC_06444 [Phialocephala subalpina]
MSAFDTAPVEVVVRILSSCDNFQQLLRFITTCKRLHSIWLSNSGTIIWEVGPRDILCFDDALMAVRATDIVKDAHMMGARPPNPFPIASLSGTIKKPSPEELNRIFALQHMMHCIKHTIFHWKMRQMGFLKFGLGALGHFSPSGRYIQEEKGVDGEWHRNLYRGLYRGTLNVTFSWRYLEGRALGTVFVVLAGAVLAGAFNEPLFAAVDGCEKIAETLVRKRVRSDSQGEDILDEEVSEYLQSFPVYSDVTDQCERAFEPLADWLVANGKARHPDDEGAIVREILHVLAAYEHLQNKIVNGERGWCLGREDCNNAGAFPWDAEMLARKRGEVPPPLAPCGFPGGVRKTTVILFGNFQVEDISLPIDINDITNRFLFANPCEEVQQAKADRNGGAFWDILSFLPYHGTAGTYSPPDALLNFFKFVLRKFDYQFDDEAFIEDPDPGSETEMPFESFGWPVLFCDGEWGDCLLVDGNGQLKN